MSGNDVAKLVRQNANDLIRAFRFQDQPRIDVNRPSASDKRIIFGRYDNAYLDPVRRKASRYR